MDQGYFDETVFRVLTGRASREEEERVAAWRLRTEENERSFRELERILSAAAQADKPLLNSPPPRAEEILQRLEPPVAALPRLPRAEPDRRSLRLRTVLPWAAVLVVAVGLTLQWIGSGRATANVREVVTGPVEAATVVLDDGTVVRLAPSSRLLSERDEERSVTLEGRAYFAVAEDPARPFRIHTSGGDVAVVGTRFDLDAPGSDLRLTVVEGTVVLAVGDEQNRLVAGQMGRVVGGTLLPPADVPDPGEILSWMGNFIAFQSTPLGLAVREVERVYGVTVEIEDPELAERTVTIHFSDRSLADVMEALCLIVQASCVLEDDVVRISSHPAALPGPASPPPP